MDVNGYVVAHNVSPRIPEMEIQDFCDFMWFWITRNSPEPAEIEKFKTQLWRPPPGESSDHRNSPWSGENEMKAFKALKAQVG